MIGVIASSLFMLIKAALTMMLIAAFLALLNALLDLAKEMEG